MALSNDLISQFVKATQDKHENKNESTAYGIIVKQGDVEYVKLDGSDLLTPISSTTVVQDGDRVMVNIKNHNAIVTGDLTTPSASNKDVIEIGDKISEFEILIADKVVAKDLEAINAYFENIKAISGKYEELFAVVAEIETLQAKYANLEYITATDINVINAEIETLRSKFGEFIQISTEDLEAINAEFGNIVAYNATFTYVSTEVLDAIKADIDELDTNKLDAETADIKYATIDFSNIGEAAIEKLFSESGIIEDLIMSDGKVTGELVGVTIKGDLIEGNTVKADKLVIRGEDGIYYKLNIDALGETTASSDEKYQNGLDGSTIIAKSITADRIAVTDLVAFGATIGGFKISDCALYSGTKSYIDSTNTGIFLGKDGQVNVGSSNNYFKFFLDDDGIYKLDIQANSIRFGVSNSSVEEVIDEIKSEKPVAKRTIEGTELTIDDGKQLIEFGIDGQTTDEYPGVGYANLFVLPNTETKNGITFTNNGDGTFNVTGTTTATTEFSTIIPLEESGFVIGKKYSLSRYNTSVRHTIIIDSCDENGNVITNQMSFSSTSDLTFIVGEFKETTGTHVKLTLSYFNNNTINMTNERIQIEEGSTSHPFVPNGKYGIEVKATGKNLFKTTLMGEDGQNIQMSKCNVIIEDGIFKMTATDTSLYFGEITTSGSYNGSKGCLIDVLGATQISFSLSNTLFNRHYISCYDENRKSLGTRYITSPNGIVNLYSGTKYISCRFGMSETVVGETYETTIQVELGNVITKYEPYKYTSYLITLDDRLKSSGEIKDQLTVTKGIVEVFRRVGVPEETVEKYVFDEDIPMYENFTNVYYITDLLKPVMRCTYYTVYAMLELLEEVDNSINDIYKEITEQRTDILMETEALILKATTDYITNGDYQTFRDTVEAQLKVMSDNITMRFTSTSNSINDLEASTSERLEKFEKHFQFSEDGLVIGSSNSAIKLEIDNDDGIIFSKNGETFGYWDGNDFYTGNIKVRVNERAQFGDYAYVPRSDGSLMFLKVN